MRHKEHNRKQRANHPCANIDFLNLAREKLNKNIGNQTERDTIADTHQSDYMQTQEGKNLPVPHCIEGSEGWQLMDVLEEIRVERNLQVYDKKTFGCPELARDLAKADEREPIELIELIGVCTDICVVSNALTIKAHLPEVPIYVDPACCAGVTPQAHEAALATMKSCQILM